jgi:hypothetical protein
LSELMTETGTGLLIFEQTNMPTRYRLHADVGGRAVMIELFDRPAGMASGEHVRVALGDGRIIRCQILDDSHMCTVVGDGLPEAPGQ